MRVINKFYKDESGQVLPLFALMIAVLLATTALVVDGGRMLVVKSKAYNIAEASALSAKDNLLKPSDEDARDVALAYAIDNGADETELDIATNSHMNKDGEKIFDEITVKVNKNYNLLFGGLFGSGDGVISEEYTLKLSEDSLDNSNDKPGDNSHPYAVYSISELDSMVKEYNYIPISNAKELNNIRNKKSQVFGKDSPWEGTYTSGMDKSYIIVSDIDMSVYNNFKPLCSFNGVFDGGGYKVSNLTVDLESDYAGLFCRIRDAKIMNLGLVDVDVKADGRASGMVGMSQSSTIDNSYVTGKVSGDGVRAGGLVAESRSTRISNSFSSVDIEGDQEVGGLVGYGHSGSAIINSYSSGQVKAGDEVGGLVGYLYSSTIDHSYSIAEVVGDGYIGGLVGRNRSAKINDSYYSIERTGQNDNNKGVGKPDKDMRGKSPFINWDSNIWKIIDGSYPKLRKLAD